MILFHILDEAETSFPFTGMTEFEDPETSQKLEIDASGIRQQYMDEVNEFRDKYKRECFKMGVDYVPIDTSMQFDKALMEYLLMRRSRG